MDVIGNNVRFVMSILTTSEIIKTPLEFLDARNYQVTSEKLHKETGFKAEVDLKVGIDEIYELISKNRIKDITDPRYSNQNFLNLYGVK